MAGKNWLTVDLDGSRKTLARRVNEFSVYELVQNAWDGEVTQGEIRIDRPQGGRTELKVIDDSPTGFRDLSDA